MVKSCRVTLPDPLDRVHPTRHLSAPGALQRTELLLLQLSYSLFLGRQLLLKHP